MAKAVGVAAGHVGGASAAAEQLLEAVGLEPHAGPQLAGPGDGPHERARRPPADGEVGLRARPGSGGAKGDDALLVALAVANQQAGGGGGRSRPSRARSARRSGCRCRGRGAPRRHRAARRRWGIARRHQARELGGAEGLYDLGREADVAQAAERRRNVIELPFAMLRAYAKYGGVGPQSSRQPAHIIRPIATANPMNHAASLSLTGGAPDATTAQNATAAARACGRGSRRPRTS